MIRMASIIAYSEPSFLPRGGRGGGGVFVPRFQKLHFSSTGRRTRIFRSAYRNTPRAPRPPPTDLLKVLDFFRRGLSRRSAFVRLDSFARRPRIETTRGKSGWSVSFFLKPETDVAFAAAPQRRKGTSCGGIKQPIPVKVLPSHLKPAGVARPHHAEVFQQSNSNVPF